MRSNIAIFLNGTLSIVADFNKLSNSVPSMILRLIVLEISILKGENRREMKFHTDLSIKNLKRCGRRRFIEWPARSPHLTPIDFLCSYIKSKSYFRVLTAFNQLKERIWDKMRTPKMFVVSFRNH
jgi:rRNA-processing protein FCF1